MTSGEEIFALLGKELLIKVRRWYYVGTPTVLSPRDCILGVEFSPLYCVGYSHNHPLFTRKTGITIIPKHPGFFELPHYGRDEINSGGWFALNELQILEINKKKL